MKNNQINLISEFDKPTESKRGIKNYYENDVTGFLNDNSYFFKKFKTGQTHYVYVTSTNEIHSISKLQYALLDFDVINMNEDDQITYSEQNHINKAVLKKELEELKSYLKPLEGERILLGDPTMNSKELEEFNMNVLLINTTEECNLRCTYCYFGGLYDETREHRNINNTFEELKPIIEKFIKSNENVSKDKQRAIYFFGGEPLLNYKLIKEVVEYISSFSKENNIDTSNILYQIATNGTLLNKEKMKFFIENNVYINVSMDGPNHDLYRLNKSGGGTLKTVTKKLEWAYKNYPDYYMKNIGIVCVITPPFDIAKLYNFFTNWEPALHTLHLDFDLILPGLSDSKENFNQLNIAKDQLWNLFVDIHKYSEEEKNNSFIHFFVTGFNFLHLAFSRVMWRKQYYISSKLNHLLGMDNIPGFNITTIGADGKIYASYEHQNPLYQIGHVSSGIDSSKAENIYKNFKETNQNGNCTTCWAARLCKIDFPEFYIDEQDSDKVIQKKLEVKKFTCASERRDIATALKVSKDIKEKFGSESLKYMQESLEVNSQYW